MADTNSKWTLDMIAIGARLRSLRRHASLTQKGVADAVGTTSKHVSEIERGVCSFSVPLLVALCRLFEVSSDYILFGIAGSASAAPWICEDYDRLPEDKKAMLDFMTNAMIEKVKKETM